MKKPQKYLIQLQRRMEVYTTKPGIQFYTGNNIIDSKKGKDGVMYRKEADFVLKLSIFPMH